MGGVTTIEEGGTGANNRKNAIENLLYLGLNPITSTEEDAPKKWWVLGVGYANLTKKIVTDQPSDNGFLINIVAIRTTRNVAQIFLPLGGTLKTIYYRLGYGGDTSETDKWSFNWVSQGSIIS